MPIQLLEYQMFITVVTAMVNTALLQQLWQISLDIVHIQEYLGCVRSSKNLYTLCVVKRKFAHTVCD